MVVVVCVEGGKCCRLGSFERFEFGGMGVLELWVGNGNFWVDGSKFFVVFFVSGLLKG